MVIYYEDGFNVLATSTDPKPTKVPEGLKWLDVDTQKYYVVHAGQYKEIKSGVGIWSPTQAETLQNKKIVVQNNDIESTGAVSLFGFDGDGNSIVVPIGAGNEFLKANSSATGFEFGNPSVGSGSWNPATSETISNKTAFWHNNTFRQTTPNAGDLLIDNGTKFVPLVKGSNDTYLGINSSGVVGWYPISGISGGGGGGSSTTLSRPSQSGVKEGWYDGGVPSNFAQAHGLLDGEITTDFENTPSIQHDNTRGKYLRLPQTSSTDDSRFRVSSPIFRRNWDSYMLLRMRYSSVTNFRFFAGFTSVPTSEFTSVDDLNNRDVFMITRTESESNFVLRTNDGSGTHTPLTISNANNGVFNTDVKVLEIRAVSASNKFQYRINGFPSGTWIDVTTAIPRSNIGMGLAVSTNSETSTSHDLEIYHLEAVNKFLI